MTIEMRCDYQLSDLEGKGLICAQEGPVAKSGKAVSLQGTTASSNLTRASKVFCTPINAETLTGARIAQPKPYGSDNLSIRLLAVELNRRFHSDLPQLPYRM
jgi:hypothetical protein